MLLCDYEELGCVCVCVCAYVREDILTIIVIVCLFLQHETLEALLERGEKLDDLVSKTDKLSSTSKAFYKEVSNAF